MAGSLFFSFIVSLVLCMVLIPGLRTVASRLRLVDIPSGRKIHAEPVAIVGGIAFAVSSFTSILMWAPQSRFVAATLLAGAIILVFGVWDDRVNLGYKVKLLGQVMAALVLIFVGDIRVGELSFPWDTELPLWLSVPVTILVLVGTTNAVNLADGLDGLAGGLSLLSLAGFAYLAYLSGDSQLLIVLVAMLGGVLGFLRFNTHPARIFMGDAGSQLLGLVLGLSAIMLSDAVHGPYAPSIILLILGLPLLDTLGVFCQRLAEGRSPFVADCNHTHHKLLSLGFSHHDAVLVIYGIQATMLGLAYSLRWRQDWQVIAVYALIACAMLSLFVLSGWGKLQFTAVVTRTSSALSRLRPGRWWTDMPAQLMGFGTGLFLGISVFLPREVPKDVGVLALLLFAALILCLLTLPRTTPYLVRGSLYVGSTFVMYLSEQTASVADPHLRLPLNVFFSILAILVILTIRFDDEHRFQLTPLDYLMVFLALAVPAVHELRAWDLNMGLLTLKLIVLFFAFELLLLKFASRLTQLGALSLWVLFALGIRAWW